MKRKSQTRILVACFFLLLAVPARAYYSPVQGRWLNRDAIGEKGGKHLYAFVRNEGASQTDKLGKEVNVNSPPSSVGMTLPCKPRCGKEVPVSAFRDLQVRLQRTFFEMDTKAREKACGPWKDPLSNPGVALSGWDIAELFNWGTFCSSPNCGVPASKCGNTIWVAGQCHYVYAVNYVAFGWMCALCGIEEDLMEGEILGYRGIKELLFWGEDMGPGAKAWAEAGYSGWPLNEGLSPGASAFSERFKDCEQCGEKLTGGLSSTWPYATSGRRGSVPR